MHGFTFSIVIGLCLSCYSSFAMLCTGFSISENKAGFNQADKTIMCLNLVSTAQLNNNCTCEECISGIIQKQLHNQPYELLVCVISLSVPYFNMLVKF